MPMQPGQQMYPTGAPQQVQFAYAQQPQPMGQPVLIQQQTIPVDAQQNIVIAGEPVDAAAPEAYDKANNV